MFVFKKNTMHRNRSINRLFYEIDIIVLSLFHRSVEYKHAKRKYSMKKKKRPKTGT